MKKKHIKYIRLIFQKFREIGLQINILKCEFHVQIFSLFRFIDIYR